MRGRMSDAPSYAPPVELGAVMVGGTVSRVEASNHPGFKIGDWVLSANGWQDYALSDGSGLARLGESPEHPSYALGLLGMPGFTAYMGLLDIGKPQAGETLVVAAATGPVGATVGQIGKLKGCRVVGVAGGAEKMPPRRAGARLRCLPRPPCRGLRRTTGRGLPGRHRHLLRERRRQGLRRRLPAAQRQGPDPGLRHRRPLQRHRAATRAGPLAGADGHDPAQAHQGAGLHHLRRLRPSLR